MSQDMHERPQHTLQATPGSSKGLGMAPLTTMLELPIFKP